MRLVTDQPRLPGRGMLIGFKITRTRAGSMTARNRAAPGRDGTRSQGISGGRLWSLLMRDLTKSEPDAVVSSLHPLPVGQHGLRARHLHPCHSTVANAAAITATATLQTDGHIQHQWNTINRPERPASQRQGRVASDPD